MPNKRHHYIPRFYLNGFVDPNNMPYIWAYEKGNPNIIKAPSENIAVQKHYYSFTTQEGNRDSETLENALAKMEGQVAPIFRKIKNHESLDEQERGLFATFLALIMIRVPNFRENSWERPFAELTKEMHMMSATDIERLKSMVESLERDTGNKIDTPIEEFQKFILNGRYGIKVNPQFGLGALALIKDIAPIFYRMKWTFLTATDDYKFVTSDNPVSWDVPIHDPTSFYGISLLDKNLELTFPISKDLAFFGTRLHIKEGYFRANNKLIKETNRRTVISALRFVYSSQKSEGLNRLVQKYKDSAPKMKVS